MRSTRPRTTRFGATGPTISRVGFGDAMTWLTCAGAIALIATAMFIAFTSGGTTPTTSRQDISRPRASEFYLGEKGPEFRDARTPICLGARS